MLPNRLAYKNYNGRRIMVTFNNYKLYFSFLKDEQGNVIRYEGSDYEILKSLAKLHNFR